MTKPPFTGAAPIELVLAGQAGLHRGRIAHDFRSRILSTAPATATRDRPTVLRQCGDDEKVADVCLTGNEACRFWLSQRPGAGDDAMRDVLISLWHPLHETEDYWRGPGDWTFADNVNVEARAVLFDSMTLYLHMFGYEKATPVLIWRLWALVRAGGEHRPAYFMRASGVALLDDKGDDEHPDVVPYWDPLDPLGIAEIYAKAHLHETGAGLPTRLTHAEEMDDDRAGINRVGGLAGTDRPKPVPVMPAPAAKPDPQGPGVVVFPADVAEAAGKGDNRREVERFLGKALGARLPLVPVPADWNAWEATLNGESPWLAAFHRAVRLSQGGRSHWGGAVVCVEGPPGAGKSRGVRRVAEVSGLPYARFNCEATSDNAGLGGTSIRWLSGHPSILERLLATSGLASVCLALDELDKAGGGRRGGGGDPLDLLHGWFENETARAWRSTYLLSPIDVSNTLFLCTVNETSSIPGSLRDRMTVVRVGGPLPEHVGVLAPALAREVCRELGQDERFGLLDADEMAVLAKAWSQGGSIRRLAKLVRAVLDAREAGLAAMPRH